MSLITSQSIAELIDRDVDWRAVRNCDERAQNAARLVHYHDRLALSTDPWADREVVARRQIVGYRVQAAMRARETAKRLRKRLAAKPATGPESAFANANANVVTLRRSRDGR